MSRSSYTDDDEDGSFAMWRGQVASAIRGRRGQAMLRDLLEALDAMLEKRLIKNALIRAAPAFIPPALSEHVTPNVCALGALGVKRGIKLEMLDPEDYDAVADAFGVAHQLVQEIEWMNDEAFWHVTPEQRWQNMRDWTAQQLKENWPVNQVKTKETPQQETPTP